MAKQLCFSVSFLKVKFAVLDTVYKLPIKIGEIQLNKRTEGDNSDELKKWLAENDLLGFDGEVSLSFVGKNNTLVPQNIMGEVTHKAVYELCFSKVENEIDYNRFPEMGLINVYEIPTWVKSFFVVRYPSIIMQHEVTHLLRGIFKGATFRPIVHLAIENDFFTLIIAAQNKLIFSNTFDYAAVDDILYHVMFVLEQKDLNLSELKIEWIENAEKTVLFDDFKSALEKINPTIKASHNQMKSFKNQLLCV